MVFDKSREILCLESSHSSKRLLAVNFPSISPRILPNMYLESNEDKLGSPKPLKSG